MTEIFTVPSISKAHEMLGLEAPKHPLVTVIRNKDVPRAPNLQGAKVLFAYYQVTYKGVGCGRLTYGKNAYDYQYGSLVFTAPDQVVVYEDEPEPTNNESEGWTLAFHPDLIRKSSLGDKMSRYSFFDYAINEALHVSTEERQTIEDLLKKVVKEYSQNLDRHSQPLIISTIELLLDYCVRFYDRQFYTRTNLNSDVVSRFEQLLKTYYQSDQVTSLGGITVQYCGKALHLSPSYLSDLLKKETGKTAQEHIHGHIIECAKNKLLGSTQSIREIGYDLGFEYPQRFSNLFKAKTGISPREYRRAN